MFIETIPVGVFQCNCSIVACEATGKAVVVDPGDEATRILQVVLNRGLEVVVVAHTHAHIDHLMGTLEVVEATGVEARLHGRDRHLWDRLDYVASQFGIPTPPTPRLGDPLADGETICFGQGRMRVIHTPGHTPGSCCFAVTTGSEPEVVLSGDTLFRGSIGILDRGRKLPMSGANARRIVSSIRERLLTFSDDTRVIPGHGPDTHIGFERLHNPFLQESFAPAGWRIDNGNRVH
jgi:glyoxylase-like metal-dependent hydrolase (beta-lactamase superfamily II)